MRAGQKWRADGWRGMSTGFLKTSVERVGREGFVEEYRLESVFWYYLGVLSDLDVAEAAPSQEMPVEQASIFYILHGTLVLPWGRGSCLLVDGSRRERSDFSIHGCIQGIYTCA